MPTETALPLRIGARTVFTLRRRLVRRRLSLEEALTGTRPALPPLQPDEHGYLITALPEDLLDRLARGTDVRSFVRQRYRRFYARLDQDFDTYLAGFSAKSRSTCRRKLKRFAERSGGRIDVRAFASEAEIEQARKFIAAFDLPENADKGAIMLDGIRADS